MSVVGPRPERAHFVQKFLNDITRYNNRHWLKAGITGWAQSEWMARRHIHTEAAGIRFVLPAKLELFFRPSHHCVNNIFPQRLAATRISRLFNCGSSSKPNFFRKDADRGGATPVAKRSRRLQSLHAMMGAIFVLFQILAIVFCTQIAVL
jgi:Bacterial sugar transferase